MPAFRIGQGKLSVVPHSGIRLTEFARFYRVPWVFLGNGYILDSRYGLQRLIPTGGPKVKFFDGRWMVGFGATHGSGTTDGMRGARLSYAASGYRTWYWQSYYASMGGGGLGRVFQGYLDPAGGFDPEGMFLSNAVGNYEYLYNRRDVGNSGQWTDIIPPVFNVHRSMVLRQNQSTGGSPPEWFDQTGPLPNNDRQNSGAGVAYPTFTDVVMEFGNRQTDSARSYDGLLGIIAPLDGDPGTKNIRSLIENPVGMLIERERIMVPMFTTGSTSRIFTRSNLDGLGAGGKLMGSRLQ